MEASKMLSEYMANATKPGTKRISSRRWRPRTSYKLATSNTQFIRNRYTLDEKQTSQKEHARPNILSSVVDMCWYERWLTRQLQHIPPSLRELRVGNTHLLSDGGLKTLMEAIETYTQHNEGTSIDEIVLHLRTEDIFDGADELQGAQRLVVFAVLGWGSMLYQAAFNVCSTEELAIHHDSNQPESGLVFDTYKVSADLADRPLWVLLKAFGNLLPARSSDIAQIASETSKVASSWIPLYPKEMNAYLLHSLLRVRIRWVDALSLHLDYDKSSRTLSLFSYPSFCVTMLHTQGATYSFASIDQYNIDPRANSEDISQLLREVLLSYRLLFGQSGPSRQLFRQTYGPSEASGFQVDSLLPLMCTTKHLSCSTSIPPDRPIYFTARDFPVLGERIELIAKELQNSRPKSVRELFRDRRDTMQYWTFWLVSVYGGIGIILSLVQIVLQALQLLRS